MEVKKKILNVIANEAAVCVKCRLHEGRIKSVFGDGNINADLFIIGEASGEAESLQGLPFVGRSGKLLSKMLEAINLKREDVYIANVVKCRPPNNRKPEPDEIACCIDYLKMQIELVKPKIILTLGATATEALLGSGEGITKRRGKKEEYKLDDGMTVVVIPSYHPSYLLRNPSAKTDAAKDLKLVKDILTQTKR